MNVVKKYQVRRGSLVCVSCLFHASIFVGREREGCTGRIGSGKAKSKGYWLKNKLFLGGS